MASIFQFLSKKFWYIKHVCYQFDQSCVSEKIFRNSDLSKLKYWAAFFGKSNTGKAQTNDKDPASKESQKSLKTVESILVPVSTLWAEVLWSLKVASSHFSLRLCLGLNEVFWCMFIGSEIVKSFKLSKTKCGYIMNFGLAPYYKDLLLKGCVRYIFASLFLGLNESTCQTKKNTFYFTSKALFILKKIKF